MKQNFRPTVWLHLLGVSCGLLSLVIGDAVRHDTGIALAISVVALLGTRPLPTVDSPEKLDLVVGSVIDGGMRQGQFIKSFFSTAILASGIVQQLTATTGVPTLLLGAALGLSAIANEIEIRSLEEQYGTNGSQTATNSAGSSDSSVG